MKIRTHEKQKIDRYPVIIALRGLYPGCKIASILIVFATIFCTMSVAAADRASRPVSDARYSFGPFDDLTKIQQVIPLLEVKGIPVEQREKMERESLGFIVVSPRLESPYEVSELLRSLRNSNINDIVYLQVGDYQQRVSMGVFGKQIDAVRRQVNMESLGFDSEVIERSKSRPNWWLDTDFPIEDDVLGEIREVAGDQINLVVNREVVGDEREPAAATEAEQVLVGTTEIKSTEVKIDEVVESAALESAEAVVSQMPESTPVLAKPENQRRKAPITSGESVGSDGSIDSIFYLIGAFLSVMGVFGYMLYRMKMLRQRSMPPPLKALIGSALDSRAEGVLILDSDQTIVFVNQSLKNIVELTGKELLGKKTSILKGADADGVLFSDAEAPWSQALIEGVPQMNQRLKLKSAGNKFGVFMTNSSPLLDDSGNSVGVVVSFNHLEELDVKNQSLQGSESTQLDVSTSQVDLLAQQNPDMQGSMNAILGYAEVLRRGFGIESEESRKYINAISSSPDRAVALINDIIELSRLESGNAEVEMASFSPGFVIDDVVNLVNIKVKQQGISVSSLVEGELPKKIISDPGKIRRILTSLIGNAVDFSGKDDITVVPEITENESSLILTLTVQGAGSSLPEDEVASLLEIIDIEINNGNGRGQGEGAGLGLSISKRIAKLMGGDLIVRREPGRGIIFEASIEVRVDEDQQNEEALTLQADARIFAEKMSRAKTQLKKAGIARVEAEDQAKAAIAARAEAEAQLNKEAKEKLAMQGRVEEEIAAKTEIEARAKVEIDARVKAEKRVEEEAEARATAEEKIKSVEKEKLVFQNRAEAEAIARTEAETSAGKEVEARKVAESEIEIANQARTEAEERAEREVSARKESEQEISDGLLFKLEEETKTRAEVESAAERQTDARVEAEEKLKQETSARERAEASAEEAERIRAEAETRLEKETRVRAEAESRVAEEASRRAEAENRVEEETSRRVEAESRAEEEAKARAEAVANATEEVKAREAADSRAAAETEAKNALEVRTAMEAEARSEAESKLEEETKLRLAAEEKAELASQAQAEPGESVKADADAGIEAEASVKTEVAASVDVQKNVQLESDTRTEESPDDPDVTPLLSQDRAERDPTADQASTEKADERPRVDQFVVRLAKLLEIMEADWEVQKMSEYPRICRWINKYAKGFGYPELSELAGELGNIVEREEISQIPDKLRAIRGFYLNLESSFGLEKTASSESKQRRKKELTSEPVAPTVDISQGQGASLRSRDAKVYPGTGPVRSSLNVSNPTIQKLVKKSVSRLESQLANMDLAFGTANYSALTKLCYRLRGEADSVGLHPLIQPAKDLDEMVKSKQFGRAEERLAYLKLLVSRIDVGTDIDTSETEYQNEEIPAEQASLQDNVDASTASEKVMSNEPIRSQLNLDNPKVQKQVEQFILRLGSGLTELHHAWENENFAAIGRLSQWILRYSQVLGFDDFSQPAKELSEMAANETLDLVPDKLDELRLLFARIED